MKKMVKKFTQFRENYNFNMPPLVEKDNAIFFNGEVVEDAEKKYSSGEGFINIGYGFKEHFSRILSNLYPMSFKFRGKKVASIEGVLQGIKYKDVKAQNLVLKYAGIDAYHTRGCNEMDFWGKEGKLYWQGKEIDRNSNEYQLFLDELYISASSNPLYQRALLGSGDKYLLHHIGKNDPHLTVLTRYEFESRLNALRSFLSDNI